MKKGKAIFAAAIFWVPLLIAPAPLTAGVSVGVHVDIPAIVLEGPPDVVVIPDSGNVYFAPDVRVDLFFWNGWWWRPWDGRWYRSYYYDRGWRPYGHVPGFYRHVDPGWRGYYRDHMWHGRPWHYERIPGQHLQRHH